MIRPQGLTILESQTLTLLNNNLYLVRAENRQSASRAMLALQSNRLILGAQSNYRYRIAQETTGLGHQELSQYALDKLRLAEVHDLTKGTGISIAIIDTDADIAGPEFDGSIVERFDAVGAGQKPHPHGTGVAGVIAAHHSLTGIAPEAKLFLAVAFESVKAEGTTFRIVKGFDWAIARGARIINMSFASERDPLLEIVLKAAHDKGVILVAAAGNSGPKSAPLYPGADPKVIAATAVDQNDALFAGANRGRYVAVAAPGVDVLVPAPEGTYQLTTGTSVASAEISGIIALLLQRNPKLTPEDIRKILKGTARSLGPAEQFGAGLVQPVKAISAAQDLRS
jgi:subtilisin family serine protease